MDRVNGCEWDMNRIAHNARHPSSSDRLYKSLELTYLRR